MGPWLSTVTSLRRSSRLASSVFAVAVLFWPAVRQDVSLPNVADSVKFAVIGDSGSGDASQFQVADQMAKTHAKFAFSDVIMLGDDIYGGQTPADWDKKFAQPYKALLDAGVKFHAALGNHDSPNNVNYSLFNMNGQRYYTYAVKNVRFFALDSDRLDPPQLTWIQDQLQKSHDDWKICYFHHPLYSDGGTHGSSVDLRVVLEPIFVANKVNVVFAGHDHIYERITPQKGIQYFVSGSSGQLRKGDTKPSAMNAAHFDTDNSFMVVEIAGNEMSFEAISRLGAKVDSGTVHR
jgi:hypothetical protein